MIRDSVQIADNAKFLLQPDQILQQSYGQMKMHHIQGLMQGVYEQRRAGQNMGQLQNALYRSLF